MRVYLPATVPLLRTLSREGGLSAIEVAFAVTPALREAYLEGDLEELEYAAAADAARASLALLAGDPTAPPRRVVVAADVPDATATPDSGLGVSAVRLTAPVALDRVASIHIDEPEAEEVVRAAVAALPAADAGDDDAEFTVDEAEGFELLWYATQELPDLLAGFGAADGD